MSASECLLKDYVVWFWKICSLIMRAMMQCFQGYSHHTIPFAFKLSQALDMALLGGVSDVIALHTGLAKLSYLRVLSIADFLTGRVVWLLSNLSFPELHTLEMSFKAYHQDECHVANPNSHTTLIKTAPGLPSLLQVFPSVEHLRLRCSDDESSDFRFLELDCWWISKALFPKLLAVTFCCPHVKLQLVDFEEQSEFQIVHKCPLQQG